MKVNAEQIREAISCSIPRPQDAKIIFRLLESGFVERAVEYAKWVSDGKPMPPDERAPKDWPAGLACDTQLVRSYGRLMVADE